MKKKIFLLALFLAFMAILPSMRVYGVESDETVWYTVPELLEYKKQVDLEFEVTCKKDLACVKNLHKEKYNSDQKYGALYFLEASNFVITEINHGSKTFKMLFFDERLALKKELGVKTQKLVLKDAYVGWFDNKMAENEFSKGFLRQPELYLNNEVEGAHLMLGERGNSESWFSNYNEETEYRMADETESVNKLGTIKFDLAAVSGYVSAGTIGYSPCLKSDLYREETGCVMRVSREYGGVFFPVGTKNIEEVQGEPEEHSDPGILTRSEIITDPEVTTGDIREPKHEVSSISMSLPLPGAPNTGADAGPCRSKTVEFPWWLVIIIALGDAVVLWLFWPRARKTPKKS